MQDKKTLAPITKIRTAKVKDIIDSKTVSAFFEEIIKHPRYHKFLTRTTKLLVHVPEGVEIPKKGTMIEIFSSKPISKKKKWTLK